MSVPSVIPYVVVRARTGDPKACRELYEQHIGRVFGFCLTFCRGNRDQASDLAQETFVKAFQALTELEDPGAFPAWLMTITRRTCLRWAEGSARERAALSAYAREPTSEEPSPDVRVNPDRVTQIARELLESCGEGQLAETARLFYGEPPLSIREIAERLGLSQTAVTTRLSRFRDHARRRLLARLARAPEELP